MIAIVNLPLPKELTEKVVSLATAGMMAPPPLLPTSPTQTLMCPSINLLKKNEQRFRVFQVHHIF